MYIGPNLIKTIMMKCTPLILDISSWSSVLSRRTLTASKIHILRLNCIRCHIVWIERKRVFNVICCGCKSFLLHLTETVLPQGIHVYKFRFQIPPGWVTCSILLLFFSIFDESQLTMRSNINLSSFPSSLLENLFQSILVLKYNTSYLIYVLLLKINPWKRRNDYFKLS